MKTMEMVTDDEEKESVKNENDEVKVTTEER